MKKAFWFSVGLALAYGALYLTECGIGATVYCSNLKF